VNRILHFRERSAEPQIPRLRDDKKEKVLAEKGLLPKDRASFSELEVDEVAVAEEAEEDNGVKAGVVGQGA
jgi:hypothetical protein